MSRGSAHISCPLSALFAIAACCLLLTCCEPDKECRQDMRVRLGLSLTGDSLKLAADSVTYVHESFSNVGPVSIYGIGSDSLLADSSSVSTAYLPLKKDSDSSLYVIAYDGAADTLTVVYERQETFISLACGCAVFATIDTLLYTKEKIDSVKINNSNVTTQKETHITLFVHKD